MVLLAKNRTPMMLTPPLAEEFEAKFFFDGQRTLRPRNLTRMCKAITKDEFPETELAFCTVKGQDLRLMNGGHRTRSVIITGKSIPIVKADYDAPDEAERRKLYRKFDLGAARNNADAIADEDWRSAGYSSRKHMVVICRVCELVTAKLCSTAYFHRPILDFDERIEFAVAWGEEAKAFFGALDGAPNYGRDRLLRKPVVSVLLPEFRHRRNDLTHLVYNVSRSSGLREGTASWRLHQELQRATLVNELEYSKRIAYCVRHYLMHEATGAAQRKPLRAIPVKFGPDLTVTLPGCGWVVGG